MSESPAHPGLTSRYGPLARQIVAYSAVGVTNVVVTFGVLNLLIWRFAIAGGAGLLAANGVAVLVAMVNSYLWNARLTFRATRLRDRGTLARFLLVSLAGFATNQTVFAAVGYPLLAMGVTTHLASTAAQGVAFLATFVVNFVGYRAWAFREAAPSLVAEAR